MFFFWGCKILDDTAFLNNTISYFSDQYYQTTQLKLHRFVKKRGKELNQSRIAKKLHHTVWAEQKHWQSLEKTISTGHECNCPNLINVWRCVLTACSVYFWRVLTPREQCTGSDVPLLSRSPFFWLPYCRSCKNRLGKRGPNEALGESLEILCIHLGNYQ